MIISASRRTDIPAFFGEWFVNRLRAGFCRVVNPFNPKQVSRVSLAPGDVDAIVFWTKDAQPFLFRIDDIERMGFRTLFLYTLNDYPLALEPRLPPVRQRVATFLRLADRLGPDRVVWRYDPILLSRELDVAYHLGTFDRLAGLLDGATERVIISFVDLYRKTERRLKAVEDETGDMFCRDPLGHPELDRLVRGLVDIAGRRHMEIQSCCEDTRLRDQGVKAGKCIDDEQMRRVFGIDVNAHKHAGQRLNCGCVVSRDVGANDTCRHGCAYCYAVRSDEAACERAARHRPDSDFLIPPSDGA